MRVFRLALGLRRPVGPPEIVGSEVSSQEGQNASHPPIHVQQIGLSMCDWTLSSTHLYIYICMCVRVF